MRMIHYPLGIDVDIRDGQGRTVLETLREHESQKAVDLTQVMQSRDGWLECIRLIEGIALCQKILDNICKKYLNNM